MHGFFATEFQDGYERPRTPSLGLIKGFLVSFTFNRLTWAYEEIFMRLNPTGVPPSWKKC